MSCGGVEASTYTQPPPPVEEPKPVEGGKSTPEERKASYDETKASIKGMDDVLAEGEKADPGNPDIKKARADLKELDSAVDDVYNTTEALEQAKEGGNPEEIEEKFNAAMDAQMNFGEKYQQSSDSLEKITGVPLPPL